MIKFILKCLGAKLLKKGIEIIYHRFMQGYNYRLRLTHDREYFAAESFHHWNQSTDVQRTGKKFDATEDRELNRRSLELITEILAPFLTNKGGEEYKILDYGCGLGNAVAHYQQQGFDIIGAEMSQALRQHAMEHYQIHTIPPKQLFSEHRGQFHLIFTQSLLQYIHPASILQFHNQLYCCLAPDGKIVHISCPSFNKRHLWIGHGQHKLAQTAALPLYSTNPPSFFIRESQLQDVALQLGLQFETLVQPAWYQRYHPDKQEWYRSNFLLYKP